MTVQIATACWFSKLDSATHQRIGVSRGVPRGMAAGYRKYPKLNPGSWFMKVSPEEYKARYYDEILKPLDPQAVVNDLVGLSGDKIPTLLCWEPSGGKQWCHRGFIASWLKDELNLDVFEVGHEHEGCGWEHPKIPSPFRVRQVIVENRFDDLAPHIGATFRRGEQTFEVKGLDLTLTDHAILGIVGTEETMVVSVDLVLQYLGVTTRSKEQATRLQEKAAKKSGKGKIVGQQTLL